MTQLREDFASPAFEETIQQVTERMVEREWVDGRMTVILVRKPIGI